MCFVLDMSNSRTTSSEELFATVNFKGGELFYPSDDWEDFVSVILEWWSDSLQDLLSGRSASTKLRFMDGPYSLILSRIACNPQLYSVLGRSERCPAEDTFLGDFSSEELIISFNKMLSKYLLHVKSHYPKSSLFKKSLRLHYLPAPV